MKKMMKRTSAALLGASLMLTTVVPVIHAEEQTPPLVPSISEWAIETLNEGEKYGIYSTEWYFDGFLQEISVDKVNELLALTEKKVASLGLAENKQYKPVSVKNDNTRGDIVKRLYNIVARYDLPVGTDAVQFMKEQNVLQGSPSGLQLEKKATTQQAVLLAVRFIQSTYALAEQGSKGVAWVVEDEDTLIYLLGSIHLGTPDLYPFDKKLVKAFDESDALLVEANILDTEALEYYSEKAMYTDGSTLKDAVAPETYAKLEQVAKLYGLPMEQLTVQKPWMLSSALSMLAMDDSFGMTPQEMAMHGIDIYFLLNAQLQQKPVIELEGTRAQVDMFEGLSPEAQEQSLVAVLDSIINPSEDNQSEVLQEWFTSWKQGNVEEFAKSFQAMEGTSSEFNEMLFGLRDEQMAKKIMNVLEEKEGKYFVVVGSGHFLIDKNIRYHLEKNGYKVKPFYQ
ncbi:TraB/GumN family protein [Lysinibacillus boronitolerans]|uniref:Conjugal transfer protein TraB n=1 Tax=Lysinibacillus boronitolerans JCM 21713 = 10a = NBRC 103108 TaxID=1294264 RepID=A0ABR4XXG7_9BACI|nr:TraB/GumN family protein [Lysinibacillus boronitolerans]KGR82506.1 conjugal transfer protein TraB [Lysinibacillus boronitolerans JCM 21713 = 10a = NBRC 103108]MCS1390254.1 TraB/GumN family protein [Lysinibacillus boronitolerans]